MLYEALIILIVVFNLIDLVATLWLIENGLAVEANPFMKEAMDMGVEIFIFVKLFFVLGGLYILRRNKDRKAAAGRSSSKHSRKKSCKNCYLVCFCNIFSINDLFFVK